MSAPTRTARLAVDWTRCDGHGLCAALAPDLITADPWGFPVLRPERPSDPSDATHPRRDPAALRRLAAVCPALALYEESA